MHFTLSVVFSETYDELSFFNKNKLPLEYYITLGRKICHLILSEFKLKPKLEKHMRYI